MTAEQPPRRQNNLAEQDLKRGQAAFESGQYRAATKFLEQALGATEPGTALNGEVTIWLITAYEAAGNREAARNLCKLASKHPHWDTRKEGKRLLYILEAPILRRREEWQTKIPDLEELEAAKDSKNWGSPSSYKPAAPRKPLVQDEGYQIPEPTDPTQVETEDKAFVWVALGSIGLVLAGLAWFGLTP
ncbi:tetratricopeptide repeat protein [filamentous cyanobacterium LEGE 11480]|uniref:Tetratricopeptide repeat protein n=1 Tax=Romeriopsis navalis LEGE 11480 TaxID=2777977 RepID=A0A928VKT1_9CYAN|nr:tetratricopeptide repeat protein [Romeriopsis navalis]MBE9029472.1 tetratricopeptide repeat protein [Romeriopsis navalis LEGE 11480]